MEHEECTPIRSPLPPQAHKLHDRLIQLSLDLEDKERASQLLTQASKDQEKSSRLILTNELHKFRKQFQTNRDKYKHQNLELLEVCDHSISKKKHLALTIEKMVLQKKVRGLTLNFTRHSASSKIVFPILLKYPILVACPSFPNSTKEEDTTTEKALEEMRTKNRGTLIQTKSAWEEGEEIRRKQWMDKRLSTIRQLTARDLEPEVRRLMERNEDDMENIREEDKVKKAHITAELGSCIEAQLLQHKEDTKRQLAKLKEEIQARWEDKISTVRERHMERVTDLRSRLFTEGDSYRKRESEESRRMLEQHTSEFSRIREGGSKRILDAQILWDKELSELKNEAISNDLIVASIEAKETWEFQKLNELEKDRSRKLEAEEKALKDSRDASIDKLIRNTQQEQLRMEQNFLLTWEDKKAERAVECGDKRMKVKEEAIRLEKLISASTTNIKHLLLEKSQYIEDSTRIQQEVQVLEHELTALKEKKAQKAANKQAIISQTDKGKTLSQGANAKRKQSLCNDIKQFQIQNEADLRLVDKMK